MKITLETLLEVPCFKCLFWDSMRESSLYCDPNRCQESTEWLLKQAENQGTGKIVLEVGTICSKT